MKVFEYVIIYQPNKKSQDNGEKPKLLKDVTRILALDANKASMVAAREIPSDFLDKLDEVEVAVRPF